MKNYILPISVFAISLLAIGLAVGVFLTRPYVQLGSGVAATFSANQASSTALTINTTSTLLFSSKAGLAFWQVCNFSTSTVYLSFSSTATTTSGFHLNPQASSTQTCETMQYPAVYTGPLSAISASTGTALVGLVYGISL